MEVRHAAQVEGMKNPHGVLAQSLYGTEHIQVTMITLQPGEALKLHTTPVDAIFFGLEGQGIVEIGEEQETINANDLVFSPMRIPHRLLNESDATFRFLVLKTPNPGHKPA